MPHMLNDKFVDTAKVAALTKRSEVDMDRLNKSLSRIRWAEIPCSTDAEIRALNDDAVVSRIDQARHDYGLQAIKLMLTDDVIAEANRRYDDVCSELKSHVATVHEILDKYPGVNLKVDSKGKAWLDSKQLQKYVTDKCTITYDETDKQLYTLIGNLKDSLEALRQFEDEHQFRSFARLNVERIDMPLSSMYDYDKKKFIWTRSVYADMRDAGLLKEHELTASECQELLHRMRYGSNS